jgi:hypothetical protein
MIPLIEIPENQFRMDGVEGAAKSIVGQHGLENLVTVENLRSKSTHQQHIVTGLSRINQKILHRIPGAISQLINQRLIQSQFRRTNILDQRFIRRFLGIALLDLIHIADRESGEREIFRLNGHWIQRDYNRTGVPFLPDIRDEIGGQHENQEKSGSKKEPLENRDSFGPDISQSM